MINSLILKKTIFRIVASFFTLIVETFSKDYDILSSQIASNFITTTFLNYLTVKTNNFTQNPSKTSSKTE